VTSGSSGSLCLAGPGGRCSGAGSSAVKFCTGRGHDLSLLSLAQTGPKLVEPGTDRRRATGRRTMTLRRMGGVQQIVAAAPRCLTPPGAQLEGLTPASSPEARSRANAQRRRFKACGTNSSSSFGGSKKYCESGWPPQRGGSGTRRGSGRLCAATSGRALPRRPPTRLPRGEMDGGVN